MRQLLFLLLFVCSFCAQAQLLDADLAQQPAGSGDQLAHPPTVILTEVWHYNRQVPVYQIDMLHADSDSLQQAVMAAIASVRPEFKSMPAQLAASLSNYVIAQQHTGTHSRFYIHRSIIADWLIMS